MKRKFLVKLSFHVISADGRFSQFDEQLRMVAAENSEIAILKGRGIGRTEQGTISDANNVNLHWKFIDVTEIYELDELGDGEQLYSTTLETDAASYIPYLRSKAMELQAKSLTFA
jgi:hypothetical protein